MASAAGGELSGADEEAADGEPDDEMAAVGAGRVVEQLASRTVSAATAIAFMLEVLPVTVTPALLRVGARSIGLHQLLLPARGHRIVVTELHQVRAFPSGQRLQA